MANNNFWEKDFQKYSGYFKALAIIVGIICFLIILNLLFPHFVSILLNIFWLLLVAIIIVFFTLGILVLVGMRRHVGKILDVFLESSLTLVDVRDLIKEFIRDFIRTLKAFLIYLAPVMAYVAAILVYIAIIVLYKSVGRSYDVITLTILLTFSAVFIVGLLNRPQLIEITIISWQAKLKKSFKGAFIDALEVVLFVFFLTMDSTHLFFLPATLNVPLRAEMFGVDLMQRSIIIYRSNVTGTVNLIGLAILIEIIRNVLRIVAVAKMYYRQNIDSIPLEDDRAKSDLLKKSIRKGFSELKDEIIKFIAFTTVLFAVFMGFPRLKLLALVSGSLAALILDIFIPSRLTQAKGTDLVSRIIAKIFRL
jgi:hypothetical protein